MSSFYVASAFRNYKRVREVIDQLKALGHYCTYDWTRTEEFDEHGELKQRDPHDLPEVKLADYAEADLDGVYDADFFVLIGHEKLAGAWIEFGAALADPWCNPIFVIEPCPYSIFLHLPKVHRISDWDAFVASGALNEAIYAL